MFRGSDRRRRQKRRGGDEGTAVPAPPAAPAEAPALEVESCELVDVGDGDALLRLSGRWSPEPPQGIDLVSFGDGAIERIEPLPPGASVGADGIWHVAFCVAEAATGAHLALMTPAGAAIGLPAPTRLHSAPIGPSAEQQELAVEREARAQAEQRLAHALEDLSDARALVDQLRRRCELSERGLSEFRDKLVSAWGETASMREMLDEREAAHEAAKQRAREADEVVAEVEARARRSRRELATRRDELEAQCARLRAELEQREAPGLPAAEQLAATEALRAEAADALTRFEAARAEADSLESQLAEAQQLADAATAATARAAREILEERQRTDEAARQADVYSERLARAEQELAQATPAHTAVENDLRHLLEKRERELEAARAELAEQRTRYAAVASEVPPAEEPPADAVAGEQAEPWSRVDEDLLERLARAKSLAGQD